MYAESGISHREEVLDKRKTKTLTHKSDNR